VDEWPVFCIVAVMGNGGETRWWFISSKLVWLVSGGLLIVALGLAVDTVRYVAFEHRELPDIAVGHDLVLDPSHIERAAITSGNPVFRDQVFSTSRNVPTFSGIWECQGPTKVRFDYATDETVYILEGNVDVEYKGIVRSLHPGSVAFFPAGSSAHWDVPVRVRKAFVSTNPGRLRRFLRRVLFSYP
jgi:uncharacterized cupin superfamily protein